MGSGVVVMTAAWAVLVLWLWLFFVTVATVFSVFVMGFRVVVLVFLGKLVDQRFVETSVDGKPKERGVGFGQREETNCGFKHKLI